MEEEELEKKRHQRKVKREREKLKKKEFELKKKEAEEKQRFLNLPDREKVNVIKHMYLLNYIYIFN